MGSAKTTCSRQPKQHSLPEIRKEVTGSKGRYILSKNGIEADLTFSILSPETVIADHTGVPDALRGSGAGLALVTQLVDDTRAEGFKIIPLCPFVNAQRRKHPDWSDAFQV